MFYLNLKVLRRIEFENIRNTENDVYCWNVLLFDSESLNFTKRILVIYKQGSCHLYHWSPVSGHHYPI